MLRKTHIRRPAAIALMLLGAALLWLAPETWFGTVLLALGVLLELAGIAIKRKD